MTCSLCGRENEEGVAFCAHCGERLPGANPGAARMSGLAVASLILGVLGIFAGLTSLPGLVAGVVALNRINRSRGTMRGAGLAATGLVVSVFTLLFAPAVFAPMLLKSRVYRDQRQCQAHLQALRQAAAQYAGAHGGYLPGANWCDALKPYAPKEAFSCPSRGRWGYAMNRAAVGRKLADLPQDTVIFYESDGGANAVGDPAQDQILLRHVAGNLVALANGHTKVVEAPTSFG